MKLFRKPAPEEPPAPGSPLWGGVFLPPEAARGHFLAVGAIGSGKTLTMQMLMNSVLPVPGTGGSRRALVYDAHQEMLPFLKAIAPAADIFVMDPLDARSVTWDLAADVDSPAAALELASILIPDSPDSVQLFFHQAAHDLARGLLTALHERCPGSWSFRDLIAAADNDGVLRKLLPTRNTQQLFQGSQQVTAHILDTLRRCLLPYAPIAAAWEHAERRLSLKEWLQSESILVLGNNCQMPSALKAINRALLNRLAALLFGQASGKKKDAADATWLFLEDAPLFCPLSGLGDLLAKGLRAETRVCIALQSIERVHSSYSPYEAEAALDQCQNLAVLRVHSSIDAEWASRRFGVTSAQTPVILPAEFLGIPRCSPSTGLPGFYLTTHTGAYRNTLSFTFMEKHLPKPSPNYPAFIPRSEDQLALRPWNEEDDRRLGLDRES